MNIIRIDREFLAAPSSVDPIRDELAARLLALGGEKVIWMEPQQMGTQLLESGKEISLPVEERRGKRNNCHGNAARIWGTNIRKYQLVNGFALHGCIWRPHSWVVSNDKLIETTVPAERYYGVALDLETATEVWAVNYLFAENVDLTNASPGWRKRHEVPLGLLPRILAKQFGMTEVK